MSYSPTPEQQISLRQQAEQHLRNQLTEDLIVWALRDRLRVGVALDRLCRSMTLEQLEAVVDGLDATYGRSGPSAGATKR